MTSPTGGWPAALLLAALGSACAFDQGGVAWHDGGGGDDVIDAAPGSPDANRAPDAAAPIDAGITGPGVLHSRRTDVPPLLDADLSDWNAAEWIGYPIASSAQFGWRHASYDDSAGVQFASLHDDQYLYFFFEVTDDLIRIDSTTLYQDDAVNLYLDAKGDRSGPYGTDDHDLVIDAGGTYEDYATGASALAVSGQIQQVNGGYHVELRLAKSSLGASPLPSVLGFDVAITDDDGYGSSDSDCHGLWFLNPSPRCTACCTGGAEAWCDTTTLGRLVLD